jgi:hypothetical protein
MKAHRSTRAALRTPGTSTAATLSARLARPAPQLERHSLHSELKEFPMLSNLKIGIRLSIGFAIALFLLIRRR